MQSLPDRPALPPVSKEGENPFAKGALIMKRTTRRQIIDVCRPTPQAAGAGRGERGKPPAAVASRARLRISSTISSTFSS
jgi:hypothetical protein